MDLIDAINKRKTTRGFMPDPVPLEILREIMTAALRAPSWGNPCVQHGAPALLTKAVCGMMGALIK